MHENDMRIGAFVTTTVIHVNRYPREGQASTDRRRESAPLDGARALRHSQRAGLE